MPYHLAIAQCLDDFDIVSLSFLKCKHFFKKIYESGVRMQGMSEELALQLMQLHPNEQQNEAYSYANECERSECRILLQRHGSCEATE